MTDAALMMVGRALSAPIDGVSGLLPVLGGQARGSVACLHDAARCVPPHSRPAHTRGLLRTWRLKEPIPQHGDRARLGVPQAWHWPARLLRMHVVWGAALWSKPTRARVGRRRCKRHAPGVQSRVFVLHVTGS